MIKFSARVTDLPNAGIGTMMRYASKYEDAVSLGQGTPQFPTPQFIYDGVLEEAKRNALVGMYSDTKPHIENHLKKCIAHEMQSDYGFLPDMDRIEITVGAAAGLFSSIMSLVGPGDEVLYFEPSYPLHLMQLHIAEAIPVFVPYSEKDGWSISIEACKKSISPRTKLVILTNPNNPTGTILSEQDVHALSEIIVEHDLILLLDEAYSFLTYGKPVFSPLRIPAMRDRTILCRSFSKEFAMTGWRIGYAYALPEMIAKIRQIQITFSVCPPTTGMVGATIALTDPRGKEATAGFVKKITESKQAICSRLARLPKLFSFHEPDGAYYVFAKYKGFDMPAMDFAKLVVDEAHVVLIPGGGMGPSGEGHVRMSFAADASVIHAAFDRLDVFAKTHGLI